MSASKRIPVLDDDPVYLNMETLSGFPNPLVDFPLCHLSAGRASPTARAQNSMKLYILV